VRPEAEDEVSDTVSISTAPHEIGIEPFKETALVTSLVCPRTRNGRENEVFFVGKEDGAVYLHKTRSGSQLGKLFDHGFSIPIIGLYFDEESRILASVDSSSRVVLRRVSAGWKVQEPIFNIRTGVAVDQLGFSHKHSRMLICSAVSPFSTQLSLFLAMPLLVSIDLCL
jgi:hypothetical protein